MKKSETLQIEGSILIERGNCAIKINSELEYNGKNYVDIRFFYQDKATKELKPSVKGVMLTPVEFKKLSNYILALNEDEYHSKRLRKLRKKEKLENSKDDTTSK